MKTDFEQDAEGLLAELQSAGIDTADFGRFGQAPELGIQPPTFDHASATPILIKWLPRVQTPPVKEAIARSLTGEAAARGVASPALVVEFRRAPTTGDWMNAKWAFGLALSTLADGSVADDLIELLHDSRHGTARQMLCDALRRTEDRRAPDVLIGLIADREISGHAIHALRSYGPKSSLPYLSRARPQLDAVLADPEASGFAKRMASKSLERIATVS